MTRPVILLPRASLAIANAVDYYERVRPGYGDLFLLEAERVIDIIAHWPEAYALATPRLRRAPIRRFTDTVVYRPLPTFIRVVDVISDRRNPAVMKSFDPS